MRPARAERGRAQNTLLLAVVWPVLIVAVFLPLAVRRYHATAG
ncbi:hypothetical protein [Pseudonocardia sp.]|jgi:ABC-2 type transport system permease protein